MAVYTDQQRWKNVKDLQFHPFFIFDSGTSEFYVTQVLKFHVAIEPHMSLEYTFYNSGEIYDMFMLLKAHCNPPVLLASNLLFKDFGESVFKIGITESYKVVDTTVPYGVYPDWFPNKNANSLWRYDQSFCEAVRYSLNRSVEKTVRTLNHDSFLNISNGTASLPSEGDTGNTGNTENTGNIQNKGIDICPKDHEVYSVNMNANVYDRGALEENQSMFLVTSASSKKVLKMIRQQKSLDELGAEVGGYMGLLIGASLVTVMEFLEYFLLLIYQSFFSKSQVENC